MCFRPQLRRERRPPFVLSTSVRVNRSHWTNRGCMNTWGEVNGEVPGVAKHVHTSGKHVNQRSKAWDYLENFVKSLFCLALLCCLNFTHNLFIPSSILASVLCVYFSHSLLHILLISPLNKVWHSVFM
jgi:hypothetical protein